MDDKGKLKLLSKNADAAAASTEKLSTAQDRNTMSSSEQTKKQKGVAQAGMNSTKAFSKMTTGIQGGLVPAYAALASHVFAVTAGFGVLKRAAAFDLLEEGLIRVGAAAGQNLPLVARQLREITGQAVSSEAAMRATAVAVSAGFGTEQLIQLTKVAKGASVALGRDMGDALDRLVRGTAKLEPEILDELGIMVRLDDAVADYAISLNKTAQELSQFERRQAFLNATIDQGLQKFGLLADTSDVNPYDKLSASFDNLTKSGLGMLNKLLIPLIEVLSTNPAVLVGALVLLAKGVAKQVLPTITESAVLAKKAAAQTGKDTKAVLTTMETNVKKSISKIGSFQFASNGVKNFESKIRSGSASVAELEAMVKKLEKSEQRRSLNLETHDDTSKKGKERAAVVALRNNLIELIKVEKQRLTGSVQLAKAKNLEALASQKAATMARMETAGALGTAKAVVAGIANQGKTALGATGAMNKLKLATVAVGNAAKIAGAGIMAMAGPIGVAIMFISMFLEEIKSLLHWMGLTGEKIDENMETFSNFARINDELSLSYARSTTDLQDYEAGLRAMVGVTDQVSAAFARQTKAQKAAEDDMLKQAIIEVKRQEQIVAEYKTAFTALKNGDNIGKGLVNFLAGGVRYFGEASGIMNSLEKAQNDKTAAANAIGTFDKNEGMALVSRARAEIEKNSNLKKLVGDDIKKYTDIEDDIDQGVLTSAKDIQDRLDAIGRPYKEIISAVDGAAEATKNFRSEASKVGSKRQRYV